MKKRPTPEGMPSARTASNSTVAALVWLLAFFFVALLGEVTK
ncbi:MAG TPA: hypothetical protein PLN31_19795 [Azoarcus taiwanensis]|nr:hypothetical protein [Rhodocyclaceae bacterium]HRQ59667.1 hypothetical protein [Azoarcus taiwanensis]